MMYEEDEEERMTRIEELQEFEHITSCRICVVGPSPFDGTVYVEPCPRLREIMAAWDATLALSGMLEGKECLADKERIRFNRTLWDNAGITIN